MITRIGNVFYWAGCVLAFGWLVVWLYATITVPNIGAPVPVQLFITFGGAAVIWMIGRAIRCVLAAT